MKKTPPKAPGVSKATKLKKPKTAPRPAPAKTKTKGKAGRPSIRTLALESVICARIATGRSLHNVCRDKDMPGISTVMEWLAAKPKEGETPSRFPECYARAREERSEVLVEQMLELASPGGGKDSAVKVMRSRLQVDTLKWHASKMRPGKYGEKVTQVHEGGETPIVHALTDMKGLREQAFAKMRQIVDGAPRTTG